MKVSRGALALGLVSIPTAIAWGTLGHITTAYLASSFVADSTRAHFQELLGSQADDYLAKVASWADSIRYTKWGRFTSTFHFIDAHDDPPTSCNVNFVRDCKATGCVISALANYTEQSLDRSLPAWLRAQAAKFVIHFVGDLHQPLHNEDVAKGGNGIRVLWDGKPFNLHHVWDTSIAEKWIGGLHGDPYALGQKWASQLVAKIDNGTFSAAKDAWLKDLDLNNPNGTAMAWSREANALVCTDVLPQGPEAIADQELGGDYYTQAGPVVEEQIARAGYRMAAWLDGIASEYQARAAAEEPADEL